MHRCLPAWRARPRRPRLRARVPGAAPLPPRRRGGGRSRSASTSRGCCVGGDRPTHHRPPALHQGRAGHRGRDHRLGGDLPARPAPRHHAGGTHRRVVHRRAVQLAAHPGRPWSCWSCSAAGRRWRRDDAGSRPSWPPLALHSSPCGPPTCGGCWRPASRCCSSSWRARRYTPTSVRLAGPRPGPGIRRPRRPHHRSGRDRRRPGRRAGRPWSCGASSSRARCSGSSARSSPPRPASCVWSVLDLSPSASPPTTAGSASLADRGHDRHRRPRGRRRRAHLALVALARAGTPRASCKQPMTFVRDDLSRAAQRLAVLRSSAALAVCRLLLLLARLWVLQVVQGPRWRAAAENNRLRRVPLEAPRGTVTDVHGEVILDNRPTYQLLLFPEEMSDAARTEAFLVRIGIADATEVRARVAKARRDLAPAVGDRRQPHLGPGGRRSPLTAPSSASSRFTRPPAARCPAARRWRTSSASSARSRRSSSRRTPRLRPGQLVGRSGLERAYQEVLGGTPGNLVVVVDALGRQISLARRGAARFRATRCRSRSTCVCSARRPTRWPARSAPSSPSTRATARCACCSRSRRSTRTCSPATSSRRAGASSPRTRSSRCTTGPCRRSTRRDRRSSRCSRPARSRDGVRTPARGVFCTGAVTIYGHPYRCWLKGGHGHVALDAAPSRCRATPTSTSSPRTPGIDRLAAWARTSASAGPPASSSRGESTGLVPGRRLEPPRARPPVVRRRDDLGRHRPGSDPRHPPAARGGLRRAGQRRLARQPHLVAGRDAARTSLDLSAARPGHGRAAAWSGGRRRPRHGPPARRTCRSASAARPAPPR